MQAHKELTAFGEAMVDFLEAVRSAESIRFRVDSGGFLPVKPNPLDAGWDLRIPTALTVQPGHLVQIPLRIASEIPPGFFCSFREKSGLALKGWELKAGTIDCGYRDEWVVVGRNASANMLEFRPGDKIAQFIIERVEPMICVSVNTLDSEWDRGGGFGSTGR